MKPYKPNYFRVVVAYIFVIVGVLFWNADSSLPLIIAAITLFHGERIAENEHDIKQLKEKLNETI
jgi:hypothetical protein